MAKPTLVLKSTWRNEVKFPLDSTLTVTVLPKTTQEMQQDIQQEVLYMRLTDMAEHFARQVESTEQMGERLTDSTDSNRAHTRPFLHRLTLEVHGAEELDALDNALHWAHTRRLPQDLSLAQLFALQRLAHRLNACAELVAETKRVCDELSLSPEPVCAFLKRELTPVGAGAFSRTYLIDRCLRYVEDLLKEDKQDVNTVLRELMLDAPRVANTPELCSLLTKHASRDAMLGLLRGMRGEEEFILLTDTEDTVAYLAGTWLSHVSKQQCDLEAFERHATYLLQYIRIDDISDLCFAYKLARWGFFGLSMPRHTPAIYIDPCVLMMDAMAYRLSSAGLRKSLDDRVKEALSRGVARGKSAFRAADPAVTIAADSMQTADGTPVFEVYGPAVVVSGLQLFVSVQFPSAWYAAVRVRLGARAAPQVEAKVPQETATAKEAGAMRRSPRVFLNVKDLLGASRMSGALYVNGEEVATLVNVPCYDGRLDVTDVMSLSRPKHPGMSWESFIAQLPGHVAGSKQATFTWARGSVTL